MPTSDYRTYQTVVYPERFDLNFTGFYEQINVETAALRTRVRHISDLSYGDDPKQQLDVYLPDGPLEDAPVLLHLHGGGFVEGDRIDYGFLAANIVKQGAILVLPSYRLCSDGATMLDAVADARAVIKWVYDNIAEYGGKSTSIVLSGHSAGAIMSANVSADLSWMQGVGMPASFIAATIMVSGVYNFPLDFHARNDILTSPEVKTAMSAMQHIKMLPPKMILAVGSIETGPKDDYVASAKAFHAALKQAGADVDLILLPNLNHLDTARVVGEEQSPVFQAIRTLLA